MKKFGTIRVLLLCVSILFGSSTVPDLVADAKQDVQQIEAKAPSTSTNSTSGTIGKGLVALLGLFAAQRLSGASAGEQIKVPLIVSFDLPMDIFLDGAASSKPMVADLFDRFRTKLTTLLKDQIPKELRNIIEVDEIRFTSKGKNITVSCTVKIEYREGLEGLLPSIARDIQGLAQALLDEKVRRIMAEMKYDPSLPPVFNVVDLEKAIERVVNLQLKERGITVVV